MLISSFVNDCLLLILKKFDEICNISINNLYIISYYYYYSYLKLIDITCFWKNLCN